MHDGVFLLLRDRPYQLSLVRLPVDLVQLRAAEVPQEEARALAREGALEPGVVVLARLPDSSGLWGRAEVVNGLAQQQQR